MNTIIRYVACLVASLYVSQAMTAQTLSASMEEAVAVCTDLSRAIGTTTTAQLKAANKALKAANIVNFGDLWLEKGKDISIDGHFIFDEEFIDSLIINRQIINFSSRYATKRTNRASSGVQGRIKMTTKIVKAGQSATWKTVNRQNAEYAIVAEPGGLLTMTIYDDNGNVLYTETENNKKGASVRKAKMTLPDKITIIYIKIKNNGKKDASFALLGN